MGHPRHQTRKQRGRHRHHPFPIFTQKRHRRSKKPKVPPVAPLLNTNREATPGPAKRDSNNTEKIHFHPRLIHVFPNSPYNPPPITSHSTTLNREAPNEPHPPPSRCHPFRLSRHRRLRHRRRPFPPPSARRHPTHQRPHRLRRPTPLPLPLHHPRHPRQTYHFLHRQPPQRSCPRFRHRPNHRHPHHPR